MDNQIRLLKIVEMWKIAKVPEYRGFRCADCQKYIHKAFHHYLYSGGFNTPVHFCSICEKRNGFKKGHLKSFTCDKCSQNHYKMYHIWKKQGKILEEMHNCKGCFLNSTKVH